MSLQIKSLTVSAPTVDNSLAAQNDSFNTIPTANTVYDLYSAPTDPNTKKAAIVKSIRLANTHTATVKVTLYFMRPNSSGAYRRRLLTPVDLPLTANYVYIDDSEITLEPGDRIQGKADYGAVIQYLISGVEREVI